MKVAALVQNGVVVQVGIAADTQLPWPPPGAIDITGLPWLPGDLFDGTNFSNGPWRAQQANYQSLLASAVTQLANNATYLAIGSPSSAQVAAQVRALTQQMDGLARLLTGQLDATT